MHSMKYQNEPPDGLVKDLPEDNCITMSYIPKRCGECYELLAASARREYCHNCGIWWWRELNNGKSA